MKSRRRRERIEKRSSLFAHPDWISCYSSMFSLSKKITKCQIGKCEISWISNFSSMSSDSRLVLNSVVKISPSSSSDRPTTINNIQRHDSKQINIIIIVDQGQWWQRHITPVSCLSDECEISQSSREIFYAISTLKVLVASTPTISRRQILISRCMCTRYQFNCVAWISRVPIHKSYYACQHCRTIISFSTR